MYRARHRPHRAPGSSGRVSHHPRNGSIGFRWGIFEGFDSPSVGPHISQESRAPFGNLPGEGCDVRCAYTRV